MVELAVVPVQWCHGITTFQSFISFPKMAPTKNFAFLSKMHFLDSGGTSNLEILTSPLKVIHKWRHSHFWYLNLLSSNPLIKGISLKISIYWFHLWMTPKRAVVKSSIINELVRINCRRKIWLNFPCGANWLTLKMANWIIPRKKYCGQILFTHSILLFTNIFCADDANWGDIPLTT